MAECLQRFTHLPQPVHKLDDMFAEPEDMDIAPYEHAVKQSPQPVHRLLKTEKVSIPVNDSLQPVCAARNGVSAANVPNFKTEAKNCFLLVNSFCFV